MSFNPHQSRSGAFEKVFEAWLSQTKTDSDVEDDVLLIEQSNNESDGLDNGGATLSSPSPGVSSTSYPSPVQSTAANQQTLVNRRPKSGKVQRFHAYRAVLRKYSRRGWFSWKKSLSPGSQTDDSGVVSPGCDASVGTLKDVMEEGSDGCLSDDDSPPNIQDDFSSANGWASDTSFPHRLDSECLDHPPELTPSLQVLDVLHEQEKRTEVQRSGSVSGNLHQPLLEHGKHSSLKVRDLMCDTLLEKYASKQKHKSSRSRKSSSSSKTGRLKNMRSNGCHRLESSNPTLAAADDAGSCSGVSPVLENKTKSLCIDKALSDGVACDTASYVSRNGCEIGASDSGAGSQSESCCEESPRHDHDNLVSSGHTKTKSPQFSCDNHRFTVIPNDNSVKSTNSGSPPLVLKLKKCEQKSNIKNSPPQYVAIEVVDSSEGKTKKLEQVDDDVFQNHSMDTHTCIDMGTSLRSKRLKTVRKNTTSCQCCVGTRSPSRRKRPSRTVSEGSVTLVTSLYGKRSLTHLQACQRKFVRQSSNLSSLQTKVHSLFSCLFPRLQPVLSCMSPEGRNFNRIIDDVICLLQHAEKDDDVKDSEELSGELEHLTLKGANSVEPVAVYEPSVVLCRSPWLCLEDFREKLFLLIQLLLPELTLSIENNCYRSQRELEKFLDKVIAQNKTKA